MSVKYLEHTADVGMQVEASTLNQLFEEAGGGLFSFIIEDTSHVQLSREVKIELSAPDLESLMVDWLNELLYQFDANHFVFNQFEVKIERNGKLKLSAIARGEPLDLNRHPLAHDIKAVTYHHLKIEKRSQSWFADLILDI